MGLGFGVKSAGSVQGALKHAKLLESPERELEERVKQLESSEAFQLLKLGGVLKLREDASARFAARRFPGFQMTSAGEGLPELLDGQGDLTRLVAGIGQERFQEWFLGEESVSDEAAAKACGISAREARRLKEFVNRLYVREELEAPTSQPAPEKVFSAVAGIVIEAGKPVVGYFNRALWKNRYRIDEAKTEAFVKTLPAAQARRARSLLKELELIEDRRTSLSRVLEAALEAQAEFLATGDRLKRRPLTQRSAAQSLDLTPSNFNRLISNKSVELPWGLEAPMSVLFPSRKAILRDRFHDLALANPGLSDEGLRELVSRELGASLSRRSIAQYRKDLGLGGRGTRR